MVSKRVLNVWKRLLSLSWPVMAEHVLRTLMRTTDVLVAGFFSPAAVAAVGLADVYGRLTLRVGLGLGDGAIALSSQDTGSGSHANRNEAVSQALVLGVLAGVPFVVFGLVGSYWAIAVFGADAETVRLGGRYLLVVLLSAPVFHVTKIAARAIQGAGDTRTPMWINLGANVLNIVFTVVLAFGVGPVPELSVLGIALATAIGDLFAATALLAVIQGARVGLRLVRPTDFTIAKQLVAISVPRIAEGGTDLIVEFPFNAILLGFGTEVNAAFHIGRRMYKQIAAPIARGYSVGANVLVGQALGRGEPDEAYFDGLASTALAALTVGGLGLALFFGAEWFVLAFTRDGTTIGYATGFARAYGIAAFLIAGYVVLAGSLRGGSDSRPPLVAKVIGTTCFLLGITYLFGVHLEYGVVAAYVGIVADFAVRNVVVGVVYARKGWMDRGMAMLREREGLDPLPRD